MGHQGGCLKLGGGLPEQYRVRLYLACKLRHGVAACCGLGARGTRSSRHSVRIATMMRGALLLLPLLALGALAADDPTAKLSGVTDLSE